MPTMTRPRPSDAARLRHLVRDPLAFVEGAFAWGEGALEGEDGPDTWQREVLCQIRDQLQDSAASCQVAVASGHGVGKSALVAWLVLWYMATRPHCQVIVTANTKQQLEVKTWRELAKWHKLCAVRHWFEWTATKFYQVQHPQTWFAAAVPWSKDRAEAFAGTHDRYVAMIFDEASSIDDIIWETAQGAMTTPRALWLAFGNPTRATGRFRQCFAGGRFAHRWRTYHVDARTAKKSDKAELDQWVQDWGEDSDYVRVRVKGIFPLQAVGQFIGEATIALAQSRSPVDDPVQPLIIAVDVARYGDDRSVILVRHGNFIKDKRVYHGIDTTRLTGYLCEVIDGYRDLRPAVFIDAVGLGAGVVDQATARGYKVHEVLGNARPQEPEHYLNKRAEMWDRMRKWLETRGSLDPKDRSLPPDLTAPEYDYDIQGRLRLEKKENMKGRGLASPDEGDSLAMTFAEPVALREMPQKAKARTEWLGRQGVGWMR